MPPSPKPVVRRLKTLIGRAEPEPTGPRQPSSRTTRGLEPGHPECDDDRSPSDPDVGLVSECYLEVPVRDGVSTRGFNGSEVVLR